MANPCASTASGDGGKAADAGFPSGSAAAKSKG